MLHCIGYFEDKSSPRMRGAQVDVVQGDVARGIIPADAGST